MFTTLPEAVGELKMNRAFRQLNTNTARILMLPLLVTAITGIILGLGNSFGVLSPPFSDILITIHQGEFLGRKLVPFYVLFMGLGVFTVGLISLIKSRDNLISQGARQNTISIYKMLALVLIFPLAVCIQTGTAYRIGTDWLKMPSRQTNIFLAMHTGASWGALLEVLYTLIAGFGLIIFSLSAVEVTSLRKTLSSNKFHAANTEARQSSQRNLSLENHASILKKKIRNAIIIFSIIFAFILYFATSAILSSIAIVVVVFTIPAWIIAERLLKDWQLQQQEIKTQLYDAESESATILRAIPDSMLRMTQDGICLSYIPAKEASPFTIQGETINRHVTEFLAPEIALQFIKSARLSLHSGTTHSYRFVISLDRGGKKYHEARISAIGATEVLILIRELTDLELPIHEEEPLVSQDDSIRLLSESELLQILELTFNKIEQSDRHVLCCLMVNNCQRQTEPDPEVDSEPLSAPISEILMHEVAAKMRFYLSSDYIAVLDRNELLGLVLNCSLDRASTSVSELRSNLSNFIFQWQEHEYSIDVSISLLEVNANNHNIGISKDVSELIDVVRANCDIAKQKIEVKNFW